MPRYIDADALCEEIKLLRITLGGKDLFGEEARESILTMICEQPTADVVEVVRCKDCVYWDGRGYDGRCEASQNGLIREYTNYDDYCSYGERKEK